MDASNHATRRRASRRMLLALYVLSIWVGQTSGSSVVLAGYRSAIDKTFGQVVVELDRIGRRR